MFLKNVCMFPISKVLNIKRFPCPRWEAVYSSDEEGEAGGAETQAVGAFFICSQKHFSEMFNRFVRKHLLFL